MSVVVVFFVLLLLGVPVAFVLLGSAIWFAIDFGSIQMLQVFPSSLYAGIENFDLLSIPLFVLLGEIMTVGGLTRKLFSTGTMLLSRVPRKLAFVVLASNLFLAAILGSANAQVAVMTPAVLPEMERAGYTRRFATALTAGAALLGPIVPPSMVFIIYAVVAQVSIGSMFLAGILPGLLLTVLICGIILFSDAFQDGGGSEREPVKVPGMKADIMPILGAMIVPAIIVGSILSGVATPTESAAIAVVASLAVVWAFFDRIRLRDFGEMLVRTATNTAIVLTLIAAVNVFSFILSFYQVPAMVSDVLVRLSAGPITFLLLVFALLIVIGAVMDGIAAIIVLVPILLPVATNSFGISPIVFGVVFCITTVLGVITPPVGTVLYIASSLSGEPVGQLSKALLPYMLAAAATIVFIILVPGFVTVLVE